MYETYWRLTTKPFQNTPDPRFIYYSSQHQDARLKLAYAVKEGLGASVLSGIFGCGKTTLLYALLKELNPEKYQTAYISHPHMDQIELLMSIVSALGDTNLPQKRTEVLRNVIIDRLTNILLNHDREGKKTIVIIDESHLLTDPLIFEELRLLLNLHLEDRFLLTLVLSGQPDLQHKIENLPQFEQRIGVKCYLTNLSREDTQAYIIHRLKIAGANHSAMSLFTPQALDRIYEYSGGIPRRINRLCDLSLLAGFTYKLSHIDEKVIEEQAQSLGRIESTSRPEKPDKEVPLSERLTKPAVPHVERIISSPSQHQSIEITPSSTILTSSSSKPEEKEVLPLLDNEGSRDLYVTLLLLVETLFNQVKLGESINIQPAIPLINRVIDKITSDDHTLIALAMKPGYTAEAARKDYLAAHSANVAIIAMAIGFTQERDKPSLLRLGLAGLLHDIGMVEPRVTPSVTPPVVLKHLVPKQIEVKTDSTGVKYVSHFPPLTHISEGKAVSTKSKKSLIFLVVLFGIFLGLGVAYVLNLFSFKTTIIDLIHYFKNIIL